MANHRFHTQTLNSVCHGAPGPGYHLLSKSSSNLAGLGQTDLGGRQSGKQELRKSFSSSACQARTRETDARSTPSSEWSSTHSEIASTVRTVSSLSPSDSTQSGPKSTNHFLSIDKTSEPTERMDAGMHIKGSGVKNMTPAYGAHPQHVSTMDDLGAAVQRSLSDLTCRCKQQSPTPHMETSATYSSMSSNSGSGASAGNVAFQKPSYGSSVYGDAPDYQSHATQIPSLPRDPNVPTHIFEDVSHNPIFSDPGTYGAAVLGSHVPRDNLSNSTIYAQGGIMYSNFSAGMYPPGMVAFQNSTALPYNVRHESAMKLDSTGPSYCHSLPVPSLQFIPRLVCSVSESGKEQASPGYYPSLPATAIATLPKLVSSVSESGLDAKRILRCSSGRGEHGSQTQSYVQQGGPQQEKKTTYVVLNSRQNGTEVVLKTKDTWTMTSMNDMIRASQPPLPCKDAGVQTIPTKECKSVATSPSVIVNLEPHVYPEVNLEPEADGEKSPVREVRWDDEGMTWEVYGAEVDPEELGLAIQKHLEFQIEQLQLESMTISRKSTDDVLPDKDEKRMSFRTMMYCLRNPSCCASSSTAME
ncbi:G protein-regulated inducer of neurite outgrowth 2 [Heteronotia binoei]|uniref:G protein-regulated inducer of neurite outgrowth 2 n=1 Tax=Heteronotia binoei TaxID=13085 RepID=UPI00292D2677|nr:G protein-regulated inducer of neurite outgrowth 2 [Heteronotia binoei]